MKKIVLLAICLTLIVAIAYSQKNKQDEGGWGYIYWPQKSDSKKIQESQKEKTVSSTNETNTLNKSVEKSDSEDDNEKDNTTEKKYKTSLDYSDGYYNYDDSYDYTIYKHVCVVDNPFWNTFQNIYFTGGYGYNNNCCPSLYYGYGYNNYYPWSYYGYGYNNYYPRSYYGYNNYYNNWTYGYRNYGRHRNYSRYGNCSHSYNQSYHRRVVHRNPASFNGGKATTSNTVHRGDQQTSTSSNSRTFWRSH